MEKYLTSEQVASLLQVHPFTILKYLKNGTLEGVKIGRVYRIKESDVEKFLSHAATRQRQLSAADPAARSQDSEAVLETRVRSPEPATHELHFQDDIEKEQKEYYKVL
jgi:excisionase family DNA binding protein